MFIFVVFPGNVEMQYSTKANEDSVSFYEEPRPLHLSWR